MTDPTDTPITRCPRCGDAGPSVHDHGTWAGCLCGWIEDRPWGIAHVRATGTEAPRPMPMLDMAREIAGWKR